MDGNEVAFHCLWILDALDRFICNQLYSETRRFHPPRQRTDWGRPIIDLRIHFACPKGLQKAITSSILHLFERVNPTGTNTTKPFSVALQVRPTDQLDDQVHLLTVRHIFLGILLVAGKRIAVSLFFKDWRDVSTLLLVVWTHLLTVLQLLPWLQSESWRQYASSWTFSSFSLAALHLGSCQHSTVQIECHSYDNLSGNWRLTFVNGAAKLFRLARRRFELGTIWHGFFQVMYSMDLISVFFSNDFLNSPTTWGGSTDFPVTKTIKAKMADKRRLVQTAILETDEP